MTRHAAGVTTDPRHDRSNSSHDTRELPRCPTGIEGLDEITGGGLPLGRPTLICGSAGCGKTVLAIEFLVRGATRFGEPGVFLAFEERSEELAQNVRSLGFDLDDLANRNLITVDHVSVERSDIEETGEYDLEGLFIRIGHEIDRLGAKRVVLDTLESLFSGFENPAILRAELRRLFRWLKDKGVTAIVTAERGSGSLTRQGLEEYVSDCVILLDHRVDAQISTRRLRIVKYRGAAHGTNEYPFLIDEDGVNVIPITSMQLRHEAGNERIGSGIPALDDMLGGAGYYRGSSILISGTAGSGKSSIAAHLAEAVCRAGEHCLYFAFEESEHQIFRNMGSIGLDLKRRTDSGLLRIHAARPSLNGLEAHLATMLKLVRTLEPRTVIVDPISSLLAAGTTTDAQSMVLRVIDHLKMQGITLLMTNLNGGGTNFEQTDIGVSSIIDTWILLRDIELGGERNRGLFILKSRGMRHSNQIREFLLTDDGIRLIEVYSGPDGVLTGSMRVAQEAVREATARSRSEDLDRKRRNLERKRKAMEAQLASMTADLEAQEEELAHLAEQGRSAEEQLAQQSAEMAKSRGAWNLNTP